MDPPGTLVSSQLGGCAPSCMLTVGLSIPQTSPVKRHAECWGYASLLLLYALLSARVSGENNRAASKQHILFNYTAQGTGPTSPLWCCAQATIQKPFLFPFLFLFCRSLFVCQCVLVCEQISPKDEMGTIYVFMKQNIALSHVKEEDVAL